MELTRDEALFAADVAEIYPAGYGMTYGYSRRLRDDAIETEMILYLMEHPRAAAYG